ncbi:MAG: hypothetical protein HYZ45_11460 [Burkholderiales bacterium]|nr:hypothetical protein [Burkholderiales bacterium]
MKKERIKYAKVATGRAPANTPAPEVSSFANLLQQEFRPQQQAVHGVVVGKILAAHSDGCYQIALDAVGITQVQANAACIPGLLAPGMSIAVMFLQGDTTRPLIIGPMHADNAQPATPATLEIASQGVTCLSAAEPTELIVDKERVVIHAGQELELRCGEAAIILTSDGRILLRGVYISSQATTTQRLLAGSVQIN